MAERRDEPNIEKGLLLLCWMHVPLVAGVAFMNDGPVLLAVLASTAASLLMMVCARFAPSHLVVVTGLALMTQPAMLVGLFAGHPWQVDMHMYFFAMAAVLTLLASVTALWAATVFVAVHHLAFNFVIPELVYPGGSDLFRALLHGAILVFETGMLTWVVLNRKAQNEIIRAEMRRVEKESAKLSEAQAKIEEERKRSDVDFARMSESLNNSLGAVVKLAQTGDFDSRIDHVFRNPTLAALSEEVNRLLDNVGTCIRTTRNSVRNIAEGDLSTKMEGDFSGELLDLKNDVNASICRLGELVVAIEQATNEVDASVCELVDTSRVLSAGADRQNSSLEATAKIVSEISSRSRDNAAQASEIHGKMNVAGNQAGTGEAVVAQAIDAMSRIKDSSSRINEIITVIDSISFQTNLLALNAAVEAARAGEAGKGFAVVAMEVRSLAQRSADAASDISDIIQASAAEVEEGVRLVNSTGDALNGISDTIREVSESVERIASISSSQSEHMQTVDGSLGDLFNLTTHNRQTAERTEREAQKLVSASKNLNDALIAYTGHGSVPKIGKPGLKAAS
ncbi:methyl-accepting chemotaxis protein [Amaricoccus tamworthensis]|uniref:methyl-accepting chemotaxis protein n=1 Tax=Amaricoccus tamworthensis TaxID=57002 RepID=UPI003C7E59E1